MESNWSKHRKRWYAIITITIIVLAVGVPSFFTFYKAPTCFDGKQNGGEGGVDCGGSCQKLCSSSFVPVPPANWVRMKEVAPGVINVAAYVVNPNPRGTAKNVPYKIDFLDSQGITLDTVTGTLTLPPGRNTLAFQSGIKTGAREIARAVFKLTGNPDWYLGDDPLSMLETSNKDYVDNQDGVSSLEVTFTNKSSNPITNFSVYAILKDKDDNVIDFSKTIVDEVSPHSTAIAPFTWPTTHAGKVISIEVLPVAE